MQKRLMALWAMLLCAAFFCAPSAFAQEWLIDAEEGADLGARIAQVQCAPWDTLLLRGQFSSLQAVFPNNATVQLDEGAIVYGTLFFPNGGTLSGDESGRVQIYGGVAADDTLTVSNLCVEGFLRLGGMEEPSARSGGQLIMAGAVKVSSGAPYMVFSQQDIVIAAGADVRVYCQGDAVEPSVRGENLRVLEDASFTVHSDVFAQGVGVDIADTAEIGPWASLTATVGLDAYALCADTVIAHENASISTTADFCYGVGIRTRRLITRAESCITAHSTHQNGIEIVSDEKQAALDIDPSTQIDAPSFLFNGSFAFDRPVAFVYTTAEPPSLRKVGFSDAVTGFEAFYRPKRSEDAFDVEDEETDSCYGMPIEIEESAP